MSNILHIIQGLSLGGAARSMIATSKYSSRFGNFRHSVISLLPAQPDAIELAKEAGMSILIAPDKHTLFNEIEKADIVHFNWWNNPEIYELLRSELSPMRLMIWYHVAGNGPPQIITPQLVNFADMNIPCNPFTYNELPIFRDIPHEKKQHCVEMVYDAADFERLKGIKLRPHNHFNVGYIGTVDFVKMHKNYIRMSASVNVPDVKFIVCGGGIQDQLRNQAMNLGVEERFDFRGYVNDIKPVIEILDIYGYPLCEGTYAAAELTLQEVMYAGIPPVVFPYGGIKQLVKHEETGLVIHSESEYKEAIEYLFHHPEERTRLGRNALEYAKQIFGAENAAKKLNCVYEKMMRLPKKIRNWNSNGDLILQNQVIHINNINENQKSLSGADKLIEALGNYAQDYITSMHSQNIHELFKAEKSIASSHPLLSGEGAGGILNYKNVYQNDGFLRLWSGLILQQKGNHAEAVTELASATKFGCNHWRVFWYLAQSTEKLGNYTLTKKALQIVTQAAPEFIDAGEMLHRLTHHDNTINTLHHTQNTQEGKRSEAREILNNLLNKWPANTDALNNLAEIEILEKNWEKAAELLQRVLEHDPSNDTALKNIQLLEKKLILYKSVIGAEKIIEQKQYSEAREILKKILEIDNKHVDALNNLAVIEIIEKNYIPARSLLEKVLNIDSTNEIALENIACINRNQSSYSPAIGNESSVKIDVSIVVATKNRAKVLDAMLSSLKSSAQGVIYEVIVVEGGSSDNTLEVLHKHGINQIYNELEYFGEGKHSWPQLYNFGFSKAQGKWAMYASDDILFVDGCISHAIELLNKQDSNVAGGIFFYKNVIADPGWDEYGIDFTYGQKLLMNYGLLRLDSFNEVKGLDERYKFYCADGDICYKLYIKGKHLIPLPQSFIVHNNILDKQKKSNLSNDSKGDIELYLQRWKHYVSINIPEPRRIVWQDDFANEYHAFKNLYTIHNSIDRFWHGIACLRQNMFHMAKEKFLEVINTSGFDWLILWYLAKTEYKSGNINAAAKASEAVVKLTPGFKEAQQLLTLLQ